VLMGRPVSCDSMVMMHFPLQMPTHEAPMWQTHQLAIGHHRLTARDRTPMVGR